MELRFEPEPAPRPKGRPRLYAVGAQSDGAVALQAELSAALEAERFYEPEQRAFWPHVTVARVRSERQPPGAGERRREGAASGSPSRRRRSPRRSPSRSEPSGWLSTVRISSPRGAEYVSLAAVDLPSPEGQKR